MKRTLYATWTTIYSVSIIFVIIWNVVSTKANDITEDQKFDFKDNEELMVHFFKNIAGLNVTKNLISSPLSAIDAITIFGIFDKKDKNIHESINPSSTSIAFQQALQKLLHQLNNVEKLKFKIFNNICTTNKIKLKSEYKMLINSFPHFQTSCEIDVTDTDNSTKSINEWIDQKTEHIISKIIQVDDITPDIKMMLLNAVYFEGFWKNRFKERTTKFRTFYVDENIREYIATMSNIDSYFYGELPDLKAKFVELPYANYNLKMIIIVPNEIDGLKDIVENLESFNQTRLSSSGTHQNVYVMLPKFNIESSIDFKKTFEQMGMKEALKTRESITGPLSESISMNKVIQKVLIDVKEEGYDGAEAIDFYTDKMKRIQTIIAVNRPFLFKIIDDRMKMTLFIGFVANPKTK